MALPTITFNKGQGGLGRPLSGQDYVSGLLFYTANGNLPSGWTTSSRVKALYSVQDAINSGILPAYNKNNQYADTNYADATAAQSTIVLVRGATGDTINLKVTTLQRTVVNNIASISPVVVNLGTYTQTSGDSTLALLGASVAAFINANTYTHGFSATFATATLTLNFPKSQGTYPNSGSPVVSAVTGTITATITQPSAATPGTQSLQAIWYYHISEFFRIQPKGQLYVGFYAVPSPYLFTEITLMQNYAQGIIRQIGIYKDGAAFASADLTAINTEIVTNNDNMYQPLSALYAADLHATSDFSTLTNLNTLTANKVTAIVGQDGAGQGAFLYATYGKSITCLGAALGAVALANVAYDIGWVANFNMSNGTELDTPALSNGQIINNVSQGYLTAIDNLRYVFLLKYRGNAGSYFNDSHTATIISSDYAYIENNRVIDKADRGIYASILPQLQGPLTLNSDGTLADTTIAYLTSLTAVNLAQMVRDGELSDYGISIPTTQNVTSTGNLVINVQLLGIGVSRNIVVNIGYVLAITGGQ